MATLNIYANGHFGSMVDTFRHHQGHEYDDRNPINSISTSDFSGLLSTFQEKANRICMNFRHDVVTGIHHLAHLLKTEGIVDASNNMLANSLFVTKYPPISVITDEEKSMVIASTYPEPERRGRRASDIASYTKIFEDGNLLLQAFQIFPLLSLNPELTAPILSTMLLLSNKGSNHTAVTQASIVGKSLSYFEKESMREIEGKFNRGFNPGLQNNCVSHLQHHSVGGFSSSLVRATQMSIFYKSVLLNGFVLLDGHNDNIYLHLDPTGEIVSQVIDVNPEMMSYERDFLRRDGYTSPAFLAMGMPRSLHNYGITTVRELFAFIKRLNDILLRQDLISNLGLSREDNYMFNLLMLNNPAIEHELNRQFPDTTAIQKLLLMGFCSNIVSTLITLSEYFKDLEATSRPSPLSIAGDAGHDLKTQMLRHGCVGSFYITGYRSAATNAELRSIKIQDLDHYYRLCLDSFSASPFVNLRNFSEISEYCSTNTVHVLQTLQKATLHWDEYLNDAALDDIDDIFLDPITAEFDEEQEYRRNKGSFSSDKTLGQTLDEHRFTMDDINNPKVQKHDDDLAEKLVLVESQIYEDAESHVQDPRVAHETRETRPRHGTGHARPHRPTEARGRARTPQPHDPRSGILRTRTSHQQEPGVARVRTRAEIADRDPDRAARAARATRAESVSSSGTHHQDTRVRTRAELATRSRTPDPDRSARAARVRTRAESVSSSGTHHQDTRVRTRAELATRSRTPAPDRSARAARAGSTVHRAVPRPGSRAAAYTGAEMPQTRVVMRPSQRMSSPASQRITTQRMSEPTVYIPAHSSISPERQVEQTRRHVMHTTGDRQEANVAARRAATLAYGDRGRTEIQRRQARQEIDRRTDRRLTAADQQAQILARRAGDERRIARGRAESAAAQRRQDDLVRARRREHEQQQTATQQEDARREAIRVAEAQRQHQLTAMTMEHEQQLRDLDVEEQSQSAQRKYHEAQAQAQHEHDTRVAKAKEAHHQRMTAAQKQAAIERNARSEMEGMHLQRIIQEREAAAAEAEAAEEEAAAAEVAAAEKVAERNAMDFAADDSYDDGQED